MEGPAPVSAPPRPAVADESGRRTPDLLYDDTEQTLRESIRSLLVARCGADDILRRVESDDTCDTGLWQAIAADLGCAGLLIPEDDDGAGASYREAALVAEELGRAVAPVPFLGSAVVATTALLAAGDHTRLAELARGDVTAALAVGFGTRPGAPFPDAVRVSGSRAGDGTSGLTRLRGRVPGVADALTADLLIVPADGAPSGLYLVGAGAEGVRRTPVISLDMTRQLCDLDLEDAPARLIASGPAAGRAVGDALAAGAALLASELLGVADRCLEMTVAYVKERRQFARPVGSFQALKHRLADLWVGVTQARAAARYAAACLAAGDGDAPVATALAKAYCGEIALRAAEECVQMHGGIGFTWEHPAHLYLKRAKSASIAFGTAGAHRAALAGLVNLPGA